MLWLNHPSYKRACQEVRNRLEVKKSRLKSLRPIVFICGGNGSQRRDRLNEYLQRFSAWLTFYAEDVFQALTKFEPNANALQIESDLAELADATIIIAESPGTFAELGAFALSEELRSKLLPIVESKFKDDSSFLAVGPIRWVDKDSRFGPTIWADFSVILDIAEEVRARLTRNIHRPSPGDIRRLVLRNSRKHLLFMVVLITEILGPVSRSQIRSFLESLLGVDSGKDVTAFIALAKSLKLVEEVELDGESLYFRRQGSVNVGRMNRPTPLIVASLRALILSAMQQIPSAVKALELISRTPSRAA